MCHAALACKELLMLRVEDFETRENQRILTK